MRKKEKQLEAGVYSRTILGKSRSKRVKIVYDGSDQGLDARLSRRMSKNVMSGSKKDIENIRISCIDEINEYLHNTKLSTVNDLFKGTTYLLSDAYFIEEDLLCFTRKKIGLTNERWIEFNAENEYWFPESMKRYRLGEPQFQELELGKIPIKEGTISIYLGSAHDDFVSLAGDMLNHIRQIYRDDSSLDEKIKYAYLLGHVVELYNGYALEVDKQIQKAKKPRNEPLYKIYLQLARRKASGEKPKELWPSFIGMLDDATYDFENVEHSNWQNTSNCKKWVVSFTLSKDESTTPKIHKVSFETFSRRLRTLKKK